ncbi:MAG: tetratricopeptide repeat protein [Devosia nanyangense]|uniref:Tetratricopeptide repeat protein n=1 Tax=Devosia nanyangense TaxID=1228055 RepID=A0A933L4J3_9HYPH|nr:tetratricopeptide repeat protein [Devosia nanyangense]
MNILLRLVAASGLAGLALAAPAAAEDLLAPQTVTGSYLAGQQAMSELRTPEAAQFFRAAAAEEWDNPLVLGRAFIAYAADGRIEEAADAARHLLALTPNNEMARIVLAAEALKQRRYDAAVRDLDQLGSDSFEGITGAILKAWALTGSGRIDDALASLDKIADGGLEEFLVFHRAIMADVAGRSSDAIQYITEAHDADPYTADIVEAYARMLGNAGQFDQAIDAIVQFEAQGLNHPVVTEVKEALANKQRPGLYADSVQAGAAEMFHSVGVAFAREGSNDVSMVLLRLAAYLNPRNDTVALVIGQLYDGAGQHVLANAVYDAIPTTSPMKAMAIVRVADNLDALGDRPQALRRLNNIVTTNPTDIDAISVLGDLYRTDKQYQSAADTYTKALALTGGASPGDWRFYYVRGISYERSDQFPLAEKDFLKALELNPNQPQVLNYLGYSWVDKGMNLTRALDMIQKAVDGSPNDGYIIDSLGWAYYRLGRYDDAVVELERAAILRSTDPEINDHLGDAYWRVGRHLEARFQWNVASSLDTEGNVKKRVAPKLAGGLDAAPPSEDSAPIQEETPAAPVAVN